MTNPLLTPQLMEFLKDHGHRQLGKHEVYLSAMHPYTIVVASQNTAPETFKEAFKLFVPDRWRVDYHTCGIGML